MCYELVLISAFILVKQTFERFSGMIDTMCLYVFRLERILPKTEEERKQRILAQSKDNEYHQFVHKKLIILQGFLEKRKVISDARLYDITRIGR